MKILSKRYIIGGIEYKIKCVTSKVFVAFRNSNFFWFRILGKGLHFKSASLNLTFSERNGINKSFRVGNWYVKFLN